MPTKKDQKIFNQVNKDAFKNEKRFSFFFGIFVCFIVEVILICFGFWIYYLIKY